MSMSVWLRSIPQATVAVLLLASLGCGEGGDEASTPAPKPTPAPAPAPTPEPTPAPTPTPTPEPPSGEPDLAGAKANYGLYCASCHGTDGCGDGPLSASLDPKPALHCDGDYMNALSDEHLFEVVKDGGQAVGKSPLMAPWGGTLTDAQVHDMVAFLRTLAK